jgi:hypothetical protein
VILSTARHSKFLDFRRTTSLGELRRIQSVACTETQGLGERDAGRRRAAESGAHREIII